MRNIIVIFCILLVEFCSLAQTSFGNAANFNEGWLFSLGDTTASAPGFNDSGWRKLCLPHDWSIEGIPSPSLPSCAGYLPAGIAWYRKHFSLSDSAAKHYIYFEGIYNRSEVYLNGHLLGKRPNGYISFMYDLSPWLKDGDNVLAVRVDHSRNADSRWYSGSGIYRDVWLVAANESHIALWGVGYEATLSGSNASIEVKVEIDNPLPGSWLEVALADNSGKTIAKSKCRAARLNNLQLKAKNIRRWSLDDTYLYNMTTTLTSSGKTIDKSTTKVGLRSLEFDANKGFALNGKRMKVKGVCLHHDAGVLGAAVPRAVWKRRLQNIKDLGANAIRMSHNPQAPMVYDLCDQIGLLVIDEASDEWEFPKRKWVEGWNNGTPAFDGSFDFFEEWIERDVADMVRRDRCHPSVFLWSIGNEVDYPNDPYSHPVLDGDSIEQPMYGGYKPEAPNAERIGKIAKRLVNCVKAIDTSRPTTGALAGVAMSNATEYPEAVDVVGYNYSDKRYDIDHETYPGRIIFGSENGRGIASWRAAEERDFIFGEFVWTGADYLGEARKWPCRGLGSGLLGFGSFPNPVGMYFKSLWSEKPMAYIGTCKLDKAGKSANFPVWNYENGDSVRVTCCTNAAQARLLLDGEVVGEAKPYDRQTGVIYWDIPYRPGRLQVEALNSSGNIVATDEIVTSSTPYALRATVIDECDDIRHILVEIVDINGILVTLADNNIKCETGENAALLGLENSNNRDMSPAKSSQRRAYHGRLLAYIRGSGPVRFSSPLLSPASL